MKLYTTPQTAPPPNAETRAECFRKHFKTAYRYKPMDIDKMLDHRNINTLVEAVEGDPYINGNNEILLYSTIEGLSAGFIYGIEYALKKHREYNQNKRIPRKRIKAIARILFKK